jgi:hypothetical protein
VHELLIRVLRVLLKALGATRAQLPQAVLRLAPVRRPESSL